MTKKIIKYSLIGSLIGIAYCNLIAIIISLCINDGSFYPCSMGFVRLCDTEIGAVLLQFVSIALFGAIVSSLSLVFQINKYSLLKRTVIHLSILFPVYIAFALMAGWIEFSLLHIIIWILIFIFIYAVIWLVIYLKTKKDITKLNELLEVKE